MWSNACNDQTTTRGGVSCKTDKKDKKDKKDEKDNKDEKNNSRRRDKFSGRTMKLKRLGAKIRSSAKSQVGHVTLKQTSEETMKNRARKALRFKGKAAAFLRRSHLK